jgi:hypothetical protein
LKCSEKIDPAPAAKCHGLVLVVPVRAVPAAAVDDLLGGKTEKRQVLFSGLHACEV